MLPDVVRDEMQICVAYLVVVKREEEEEEEFFCQWLPRVLVVDTKKKYLSLARTPRVRSLSSARVTRARLRILSSSKSRLNCEFQRYITKVFGHHRRKELAREAEEKRNKKTTREKPLSRERAFLKNTNTIYDIKYAAIFHVQNDVRVPRRQFSFHRHLTHVLRRPGRRREHFTFHFLVFPVSFNCVFFYFVLLLSSLRVFFTTDQETRRKIKSKDISRSARERIKKRKKRRTF